MTNPALEQAVINRIQEKGIALPVLPDVAIRARKVTSDPNSSPEDLVEVVGQDPAIATRLIQVANSSLYRSQSQLRTLHQVIGRLGMRTVTQLVVSLATKELFSAKTPAIKRLMQEQWAHSAQVAALSRYIAVRRTDLDPDESLLHGLLHAVGSIPVITVAEDIPKLLYAPSVLQELIRNLQGRLGRNIVNSWELPDHFGEVIEKSTNIEYRATGPIGHLDVVLASIAQARGITETNDGTPIPAAERLDMDLEQSILDDELTEAVEAIAG